MITETAKIDKLIMAKSHLPEGYEIVKREHLATILAQKKDLQTVFSALKPVFVMFSGQKNVNVMQALPQAMPALQQLQNNPEVTEALARVIANL